ncbi:hypothetical protein GCK72_025775 [Caenorhabditis remanei]|uniref:Uncharacterized protein n=1 Tax=Caenorhabditis remanei TaxID=31234 RepID=A0A6A5G2V9_CAERE|nr:hypothetical protein GCK72_025775 [Caenorhabditis remanei]KAF1749308.1 hypothetical protein GCK72_025775 [Caenorhabditis remanei]
MNFPLSAPSSIARNKILACSTPKDQVHGSTNRNDLYGSKPLTVLYGTGHRRDYNTPQVNDECQDRRNTYRNTRIRNMAFPSSPPRPGTENIKNSYFTNKNRPILEALQKQDKADYILKKAQKEREQYREHVSNLFQENIVEVLASLIVVVWQLFYMCNVVPYDEDLVYCLNIAVCIAYSAIFMAPQPLLWAIFGCSFLVYLLFAWLVGGVYATGAFAFTAIFGKAVCSVLHFLFLLTC